MRMDIRAGHINSSHSRTRSLHDSLSTGVIHYFPQPDTSGDQLLWDSEDSLIPFHRGDFVALPIPRIKYDHMSMCIHTYSRCCRSSSSLQPILKGRRSRVQVSIVVLSMPFCIRLAPRDSRPSIMHLG
ncbi:unnamed protein product [Somion occarium]|uniref:Uncharacterized protein n=1 Tax=Somion occarium TaxID=3059160 RepID=A0ABP1CQH6_9APHY